jgi:SET domain-containing protein
MWSVNKSKIDGLGVFAKMNIQPNKIIDKVSTLHNSNTAFFTNDKVHTFFNEKNGKYYLFDVSFLGSNINHQPSLKANAKLLRIDDTYFLTTIRQIKKGEEITIDYDILPPMFADSKHFS